MIGSIAPGATRSTYVAEAGATDETGVLRELRRRRLLRQRLRPAPLDAERRDPAQHGRSRPADPDLLLRRVRHREGRRFDLLGCPGSERLFASVSLPRRAVRSRPRHGVRADLHHRGRARPRAVLRRGRSRAAGGRRAVGPRRRRRARGSPPVATAARSRSRRAPRRGVSRGVDRGIASLGGTSAGLLLDIDQRPRVGADSLRAGRWARGLRHHRVRRVVGYRRHAAGTAPVESVRHDQIASDGTPPTSALPTARFTGPTAPRRAPG